MRSLTFRSCISVWIGGLAGVALTATSAPAFTIAYNFTMTGQSYDPLQDEFLDFGQMGFGSLRFDGSDLTGEGLETLTPAQNMTFAMNHDLVPETITESSEHFVQFLADIAEDSGGEYAPHPYVRVSNPRVQYQDGVFQGLYFGLNRDPFDPTLDIFGQGWRASVEADPQGLSTVWGDINYTPVPEPASILGVLSLAGVGLWKRRQLKASSLEK